jgi:hypothetical protein
MAVTNTLTDTISTTYSGNGKTVSAKTGTYTGEKAAAVAAVVPANTTNFEIDIAFPFATVQAVIMAASVAATVKTNSTTAPGNTLTLGPLTDLIWAHDFQATNPLSADVTKLFVTNATSTDCAFNLRVLYN